MPTPSIHGNLLGSLFSSIKHILIVLMNLTLDSIILSFSSMNAYSLTFLLVAGAAIVVAIYLLTRLYEYKVHFRNVKFRYRKQVMQHNEKVRQTRKELSQKLEYTQKLEEELEQKQQKLNRQEQLKKYFLDNIGYEIRTPLNTIVGLTNLSVQGEDGLSKGIDNQYAEKIIEACDRILLLVDNFLDLNQIEMVRKNLILEDFDLNNSIREIEEVYSFRANFKKVSFKPKFYSIPFVYGDRKLFNKALSLAMDYTLQHMSGGSVVVKASMDIPRNMICVHIHGNGPQDSQVAMKNIFEDDRMLSQEELLESLPFSLQFSTQILRVMEGDLSFEKDANGIDVYLYLPLASNLADGYRPIENQKKINLNKPSVLLVEDDPLSRMILTKMLVNEFELHVACSADEALELTEKQKEKGKPFNLMLLDINLPDGWDGVYLMHHIRNMLPVYSLVPFIAQTSYALPEQRARILDEGFDDFVAKPVKQDELMRAISKQLAAYYS